MPETKAIEAYLQTVDDWRLCSLLAAAQDGQLMFALCGRCLLGYEANYTEEKYEGADMTNRSLPGRAEAEAEFGRLALNDCGEFTDVFPDRTRNARLSVLIADEIARRDAMRDMHEEHQELVLCLKALNSH